MLHRAAWQDFQSEQDGAEGGRSAGLGQVMGQDSASLTRTWYTVLGQVRQLAAAQHRAAGGRY